MFRVVSLRADLKPSLSDVTYKKLMEIDVSERTMILGDLEKNQKLEDGTLTLECLTCYGFDQWTPLAVFVCIQVVGPKEFRYHCSPRFVIIGRWGTSV